MGRQQCWLGSGGRISLEPKWPAETRAECWPNFRSRLQTFSMSSELLTFQTWNCPFFPVIIAAWMSTQCSARCSLLACCCGFRNDTISTHTHTQLALINSFTKGRYSALGIGRTTAPVSRAHQDRGLGGHTYTHSHTRTQKHTGTHKHTG